MRNKSFPLILFFLTISALYTCDKIHNKNLTYYTIRGNKFVDSKGRQIVFHGINVVNKNKEWNYLGKEGPQDFAAFE